MWQRYIIILFKHHLYNVFITLFLCHHLYFRYLYIKYNVLPDTFNIFFINSVEDVQNKLTKPNVTANALVSNKQITPATFKGDLISHNTF